MKTETILVNNEKIEWALEIDPEYYEVNHDLEDTLDLSLELKNINVLNLEENKNE